MKSEIRGKLIDTQCTVYDHSEGPSKATITDYEFESGPTFEHPEGEGLEWDLPFIATGSVTRGYITGNQDDRTDTADGRHCEGTIHVTFPLDTLGSSSLDDIAKSVEIEATIDSTDFNDHEPIQEPEVE